MESLHSKNSLYNTDPIALNIGPDQIKKVREKLEIKKTEN